LVFFYQAEDGIGILVGSRGVGDVCKRQPMRRLHTTIQQNKPE